MSEISVDPAKTFCKICKDGGAVVLDYSMGDLVCTSCGLVLEGHCLDEGAEWRNFSSEGVENGQRVNDRERGDMSNAHDMESDELGSTRIAGMTSAAKNLQKAHWNSDRAASGGPVVSAAKQERKALTVFTAKIEETAGRLSLGKGIVNRCIGLYQDLASKDDGQKRRHQVSWYCAFVHIASTQERATRTIREVAEANAAAAGKRAADLEKQIDKRVKEISKILGLIQTGAYVEDQELMARFVNRLYLSSQICKPASHISQEAYKYGLVGKSPQTAIVASSILIVAWLLDVEAKPTFTHVATIAKEPEATVRAAYKNMHQHISRLLPTYFTSQACFDNGLP
eukprot:CAMPEP_0172813474 /NCGR_PEP_ID=MMETSP1075-20121228/10682_1 /TAXON_ID=2916 /ORGANISM="Ceratium fusus, Strain PA161109" /LENGTH=340 /DNA_ID=CAMNT_0013653179 /DNA_START=59 /DNA_END=1078 /DNA_ORIENTATION=+